MYADYRFDSEQHNDGQKQQNQIGASKCDVKDAHRLFGAERTSRRGRINFNNTQ